MCFQVQSSVLRHLATSIIVLKVVAPIVRLFHARSIASLGSPT